MSEGSPLDCRQGRSVMWVQIKRAVAVRAREVRKAQTQQRVEAAISNGVQKLGPGSLWMFVVQCFD
jgi:hypothetical protein